MNNVGILRNHEDDRWSYCLNNSSTLGSKQPLIANCSINFYSSCRQWDTSLLKRSIPAPGISKEVAEHPFQLLAINAQSARILKEARRQPKWSLHWKGAQIRVGLLTSHESCIVGLWTFLGIYHVRPTFKQCSLFLRTTHALAPPEVLIHMEDTTLLTCTRSH